MLSLFVFITSSLGQSDHGAQETTLWQSLHETVFLLGHKSDGVFPPSGAPCTFKI